jgi:hypothetical protein
MTDHDDIRSGLVGVASRIDVGELDDARADVRDIVRRRRTRARLGAGLGAVALVIGGAVAFAAFGGSDESSLRLSADPAEVTDPAEATEPVQSTVQAAAPPAAVELGQQPGEVVAGTGAPTETQFAFPWRDGFVAGSVVYAPRLLPVEFPEEIVALFPQEVVDLFAEDRPATISDAMAVLSEAGLLDEVSAIINANPEASAAIYAEPYSESPTIDARFTTDGDTWEPIEMALPPGAVSIDGVATAGDRAVVVFNEPQSPDGPGTGTVTVATTTDLVDWTVQPVVPPSPRDELPVGFRRSVGGQGLVANESGWAVTVFDSIEVDVLQLVPADVRAKLETSDGGFGSSVDETGVSVQYSTTESAETEFYTWEELGVPLDVVPFVSGNEYRPQLWAATWDGVPAQSDLAGGSGQLLATPSGFLQWTDETLFSPDGLTWTAGPLPDPDGYVTAGFVFDGGVIVLSTNESDGSVDLYRLDETGGSAQLIDVPGLPERFQSGFGSWWAPGSALIVDAAAQTGPRGEGENYRPDFWLLASGDGVRFVVEDLDDAGSDGGPTGVMTNGNTALAQVGGSSWLRFVLP